MMSPDTRHLEAWDTDYRTRGRLWGGNPAPLPALPDSSRVLELGCGNGKNLPGMIGKGWDITAMDCSKHALQLCRPGVHKAGRVHFVVGDAVYLPFRDSAIDAVFSLHVAGHLTGTRAGSLCQGSFTGAETGWTDHIQGFRGGRFPVW